MWSMLLYGTGIYIHIYIYIYMVVVVVAFSSRARILEEYWTIHSPPALFLFSFFFKVEISSRTLIPFFRPGSVHSGSAS